MDHDPMESNAKAGGSGGEIDAFPADPWDLEPGSVSSIGEYLARQRQLRGISREELCKLTRIPMRSLERLESGAFDALDDGFVRGFVRTVAHALGLDPDDTLARMTREPTPEDDAPHTLPTAGLLRVGILLLAIAAVLVSVGLVRTALLAMPGGDEHSEVVTRRDPVRALAESQGVSVLAATEALPPIAPQSPPVERVDPAPASPEAGAPVVQAAEASRAEP